MRQEVEAQRLLPAAPGVTDAQLARWSGASLPRCFNACVQAKCATGRLVDKNGKAVRHASYQVRDTRGDRVVGGEACFFDGQARCVRDTRCPAPGPLLPVTTERGAVCPALCDQRVTRNAAGEVRAVAEGTKCNYNSGTCTLTTKARADDRPAAADLHSGHWHFAFGQWEDTRRVECIPHEPLAQCFGGRFQFPACPNDANAIGAVPGCGCGSYNGFPMACADLKGKHRLLDGWIPPVAVALPSLDSRAHHIMYSTAMEPGKCSFLK